MTQLSRVERHHELHPQCPVSAMGKITVFTLIEQTQKITVFTLIEQTQISGGFSYIKKWPLLSTNVSAVTAHPNPCMHLNVQFLRFAHKCVHCHCTAKLAAWQRIAAWRRLLAAAWRRLRERRLPTWSQTQTEIVQLATMISAGWAHTLPRKSSHSQHPALKSLRYYQCSVAFDLQRSIENRSSLALSHRYSDVTSSQHASSVLLWNKIDPS